MLFIVCEMTEVEEPATVEATARALLVEAVRRTEASENGASLGALFVDITTASTLEFARVLNRPDIADQEEGDLGLLTVAVLCCRPQVGSRTVAYAVYCSECAVMSCLLAFHDLAFVQQVAVVNGLYQ